MRIADLVPNTPTRLTPRQDADALADLRAAVIVELARASPNRW